MEEVKMAARFRDKGILAARHALQLPYGIGQDRARQEAAECFAIADALARPAATTPEKMNG